MLLPITLFENMGLTYIGPVDGNDLPNLINLLRLARDMKKPVLVHVLTKKGKGYSFAEENPTKFHGIGKFDPKTGETGPKSGETFSESFGKTMLELAKEDNRVCAITAAMPGGTGLLEFKKTYPKRTFDVGIAEEHAVSMAGGLAKQGMVPVVALYSTFLQRSFDQIIQDIALLNLHTVLAVDRAGLVGEDGETHHGVFDVGFLRQVPGMRILCPASCQELSDMLKWAVKDQTSPVAIRYPRGGDRDYTDSAWTDMGLNHSVHCHRKGSAVTIITYGTLLQNAMEAAQILANDGIEVTVLRLMAIAPLPVEEITAHLSSDRVLILEEISAGSAVCHNLARELYDRNPNLRIRSLNLGDGFVPHGNLKDLYGHYGLDGVSVAEYIRKEHFYEN